jgi:hypothetical protein
MQQSELFSDGGDESTPGRQGESQDKVVKAYGIPFQMEELRKSAKLIEQSNRLQKEATGAYQSGDDERRMEKLKQEAKVRRKGLGPLHNHPLIESREENGAGKRFRDNFGEVVAEVVSEATGKNYDHSGTFRRTWYASELDRKGVKATYLTLAKIEQEYGLSAEVHVHRLFRETGSSPRWNTQNGHPLQCLAELKQWEPPLSKSLRVEEMPRQVVKRRIEQAFWELLDQHTSLEKPERMDV